MRKMLMILILLTFVFPIYSIADDVTLGSPKQVLKPATIARVEIDQINDSRINYTIRWRDTSGEIYSQSFILEGADYDAVMKSDIIAGNVGNKIGVVLRNRILLKIKAIQGL